MFASLYEFAEFSSGIFWILVAACFVAGIVRGFTGFGLSAVIMAIGAAFIAPVQILPLMVWLEAAASLALLKTTWREADMRLIGLMLLGNLIGYPTGLYLTVASPVEVSKLLALGMILILVIANLSGRAPKISQSIVSLMLCGFFAGFASGIAGVGGLVYALIYLSIQFPPAQMRATLSVQLLIGLSFTVFYQYLFGVMDGLAIGRSLVFLPVVLIGVWVGTMLFTPKGQKYYKRICMMVLVAVTLAGIARVVIT